MKLSIDILFAILPLIYFPNIFNPYGFPPKFVVFVSAIGVMVILGAWRELLSKDRLRNIGSRVDLLTILIVLYGFTVYVANIFGIGIYSSNLWVKIGFKAFFK